MSTPTTPGEDEPADPTPRAERTSSQRATSSERAAAQAVGELSEPERLDGSEGPVR